MKYLTHPITVAFGLANLYLLDLTGPLISTEHDLIYHLVGSASSIIIPIIVYVLALSIFLSAILFLARRPGALRVIIWSAFILALPSILLHTFVNFSGIEVPDWLTLPLCQHLPCHAPLNFDFLEEIHPSLEEFNTPPPLFWVSSQPCRIGDLPGSSSGAAGRRSPEPGSPAAQTPARIRRDAASPAHHLGSARRALVSATVRAALSRPRSSCLRQARCAIHCFHSGSSCGRIYSLHSSHSLHRYSFECGRHLGSGHVDIAQRSLYRQVDPVSSEPDCFSGCNRCGIQHRNRRVV